ncbi:hypothetical protein R3P38DRAFT_3167539 [Favolaschia claudopus]|uniref:Uncharacterized protein n=1 Tax=Favolaschia claudopus TaxID=2862362 RepID=A0AAV9Z648_9AGAR
MDLVYGISTTTRCGTVTVTGLFSPCTRKRQTDVGLRSARPYHAMRDHLRAYRSSLDLNSPLGAASWAAALTEFWVQGLEELLVRNKNKFTWLLDTCRCKRISNGKEVISIHLAWTKTTGEQGGECILPAVPASDLDLCLIWAFRNHTRINHSPPPD